MKILRKILVFPLKLVVVLLMNFATRLESRKFAIQRTKSINLDNIPNNSYKYEIEIPKTIKNTQFDQLKKLGEWLRKNIGSQGVDWDMAILNNHKNVYVFLFKHQQDAMAFKLAWA